MGASAHEPVPPGTGIGRGDRAEMEILFLGSRLTLSPSADRAIRSLLHQPLDWTTVVENARVHRVVPLLYRTLSRLTDARVPEGVLGELRTQFRANARSSLLFTGELLRIIDVLSRHDIPVLPYKGPALAAAAYGDVSLRQYDDLDIILHQRDIARATELLGAHGYKFVRDITGKDVALFHEQLGVTLEVHWSITGDRHAVQISPDHLWQNLRPGRIGGRSVLTHGPEDLLWILTVHGAQHRWDRLSWACDVAEVIRGQSIDWERALATADDLAAERIVLLGVVLARDLLGAELPPTVTAAIQADPVVQALARKVAEWLLTGGPGPEDVGDIERYYITLRERFGDRLRIAFKQAAPYFAPTADDRARLPLPWYLHWMHYVVRTWHLVRSYGFAPLRRFIRGLFQS